MILGYFSAIVASILIGPSLAAGSADLTTEGPVAWTPSYSVYRGGPYWFAGPPDAAAVAVAKAKGIVLVIDLRGPEEGIETTEAAVRAAGLAYHSVPFRSGEPLSLEAVDRVASLVADAAPGTVLVHCASGQRAAGWWAADLVLHQNVELATALEAARAAGLHKDAVAAAVGDLVARDKARGVAEDAAVRLITALGGKLQDTIKDEGVVAAFGVCADAAQSITAEVSRETGASVRRTALRLRNPVNRPDEFERRWLEAQEASLAAGQGSQPLYEVVAGDDGTRELRYLMPLLFPGAVCAQCHGTDSEIPAEVKQLLAERYPEDRATGFLPGDLRGAVSVRVPLR